MQLDRFEALAKAWGGAVAGWPAEAQAPARALMTDEPEPTTRILAVATAFDERLDASPAMSPSVGLRDVVLAAAPTRRRADRRVYAWISGAGLAAAAAAGVACGALATTIVSDRPTEALLQAASEIIPPSPIDASGRET